MEKERNEMSRKDYILIALSIYESNLPCKDKKEIAYIVAKKLLKANPRFNESRFIAMALNGEAQ